MDEFEWNVLVKKLKDDPEHKANKELAQRIVENESKAVHYYLTAIGMSIMRHIESTIMHRDITAEYYMFLSAPFDEKEERVCWHRVDLYKGINCLLSTYTSNITCRHFCKVANKEKKRRENEGELLEYVDYESLIKCERAPDDEEGSQIHCVRKAYQLLSERDRTVLRCLVIDRMSALDAFLLLSSFINPRPKGGLSSEEVKIAWTNKQRQDALSLLKGRALNHLQKKFDSIKKQFK